MIDAERADHPHALADRDAQRRMVPAAADQQHGCVIQRIAGRQLGYDVAFVLERLGAAKNGGMQCAQPQRAHDAGDQLLGRRVIGDRNCPRQCGRHVLAHADEHRDERHGPGSVAGECGRRSPVEVIRLGQHDGGGLDLGRRGWRPGPGRLDDRERAGVGKGLRQSAAGLVGDDEDRTLQRHGERVTRTAEGAIYGAVINAASTPRARRLRRTKSVGDERINPKPSERRADVAAAA
jgi:hypothetical protein